MCSGYQRERIFIQNQEKVEDRLRKSNRAANGDVVCTQQSSRSKDETPLTLRSKHVSHSSSSSLYSSVALVKDIHPSFVFRQQLLSEFLSNYLPGSARAIPRRPTDEEDNWLLMLADLPTFTKALETSILAVCTAKLGRLQNIPILVKESNRLYGQGLWELQKALWDPRLMYKDETLAACMALSMYEIIECPAENQYGWLSHSGGCSRLVRLRGPEAHHTALGHNLFRSCRYSTVCSSTLDKR